MSGSGEVLLRSGDLIAGRFQLSSRVSRRGATQVWRARDVVGQCDVAVKVLMPPEEAHEDVARAAATGKARFLRESELLLTLDDPGIVKHLASGEILDGALYLVTQWLEGTDLHDRLREGPVPLQQAVRTVRRIAEALSVVHRAGLIHRDVKPRNIRLDPDLDHPRLIDFGLARDVRSSSDLTLPGTFLGTPRYVAPEQARGQSDIDVRADLFSLGCVLYECVTGQRAFDAKDVPGVLLKIVLEDPQPVEELCPQTPQELVVLLRQLLSKDRTGRPASSVEVAARLADVLGEHDTDFDFDSIAEVPVAVGRSDRPYEFVVLTAPVMGGLPTDSLRIVELLSAFSGRLTTLADGSLAATMSGGGVASDRAAVSAHVALALRDRLPDVAIAVGAGHGSSGGASAAGEAIEHVTALLRSGLGTPPTVALDDTVARLLPPRFAVQADRGTHALTGVRDVAPARTLLGKPTRCVGREHELTALSDLFAHAIVESSPKVALVTGPAGFGKSRLRYELLRRLWRHGQPALVLFGRGEPLGGASPFSLVGSALRRSFGFIRDEPPDASRRRVRERVAAVVGAGRVDETTEFIGRLAGLPFSDETNPPYSTALADALVMGDHLRRALREYVEAECRQRPCVLVLEDLHWGDRASLRLVRHVVESIPTGALFVLALGRPEVEEQAGALLAREPDLHVELGPLSRDAASELAFDVLGANASSEDVGRIVSRAAGNAHFLEELLRAAAEGATELPGTISAMILSRIDGLEPAARQVLRAASLFGMRIPAFGLSAVVASDVGMADLTRIVTDLCARELLSAGGDTTATGDGWYMFRQALLREVVYQSLTEEDRLAGHRMVGQWLSENAMAPALVVAEHFRRANELARAAACYGRAAVDALEGNDFEAAVQHAESGLECSSDPLQRGVLLLHQAEGHQWMGAGRAAQSLALEALEMLPRGEAAWCQALSVSAMAATRLAERDIAMNHLRDIEAVLADGSPTTEQLIAGARLAANVGLLVGGTPVRPLVDRLEAEAAKAPIVSPTLEARLSILRARDAALRGDVEDAIGAWRRAAAFFEQGGDVRNQCNCQINTGFRLSQLGAYDEAEDLLRRAHVTAERLGLSMIVPATKNNLGFVLGRLGRLSEAAGLLRDAIRLAAIQQDRRMEGSSRIYLSEVLRLQGDVGGAEREARAGLEAVSNIPASRALNLAMLADCLMASERPAQAMAPASDAAELLDSLGSVVEGDIFIRRVYAEVLDLNDRQPQAKAALAAALRVLRDRAARILGHPERERFLDGVPENRRVLLLARLWGMDGPS